MLNLSMCQLSRTRHLSDLLNGFWVAMTNALLIVALILPVGVTAQHMSEELAGMAIRLEVQPSNGTRRVLTIANNGIAGLDVEDAGLFTFIASVTAESDSIVYVRIYQGIATTQNREELAIPIRTRAVTTRMVPPFAVRVLAILNQGIEARRRAALHIGPSVPKPTQMFMVTPTYSEPARASVAGRSVTVELLLGFNGEVISARIVENPTNQPGMGLLVSIRRAILDAVRQWMFVPTLQDGLFREVLMTTTVQIP